MRKKNLFTILAIAALSLACFCACSAPKEPLNYEKLEELLENKQYDEAINMIQQYRNEEYLAEHKVELDKEKEDFLASIVGTYVPNHLSNATSDNDITFTINDNMTITVDGQTYAFEFKDNKPDESDPSPYHIQYKVSDSEGYTVTKTLRPYITEEGYAICNSNVREHDLDAAAKESLTPYVGTYVNFYTDSRYAQEIVINDDFTATIDGQSYPIEYTYSAWDKKLVLSVVGYDRYGTSKADSYSGLYMTKNDLNFITLWDSYYQPAQLDTVEITGENLYDYFEWTDWYVERVDRNAFDEITSVSFARALCLKEEYFPYYYTSSVAMEFEYIANLVCKNSTFRYNADTGNCVVVLTEPEVEQYRDEKGTYTISYLNSEYDYENNKTKYVYLTRDTRYFSVSSTSSVEGSVYTFSDYYYPTKDPQWTSVLRSNTTISFIKKGLE